MPDKPTWIGRLEEAVVELEHFPSPWVDRATLQKLLGVGARRAQQLLAPAVTRTMGRNGLAERRDLIAHLRKAASGEAAGYERRRRRNLGRALEDLRRSWTERRTVLVEAPAEVVHQDLAGLPAGISLTPGRILLEFRDKDEAFAQLLALVMAIGNDPDAFEARIAR